MLALHLTIATVSAIALAMAIYCVNRAPQWHRVGGVIVAQFWLSLIGVIFEVFTFVIYLLS